MRLDSSEIERMKVDLVEMLQVWKEKGQAIPVKKDARIESVSNSIWECPYCSALNEALDKQCWYCAAPHRTPKHKKFIFSLQPIVEAGQKMSWSTDKSVMRDIQV